MRTLVAAMTTTDEALLTKAAENIPKWMEKVAAFAKVMVSESSQTDVPKYREKLSAAVKSLKVLSVGPDLADFDHEFKGATVDEFVLFCEGTIMTERADVMNEVIQKTEKALKAWRFVIASYADSTDEATTYGEQVGEWLIKARVAFRTTIIIDVLKKNAAAPLKLRRLLRAEKTALGNDWDRVHELLRTKVDVSCEWQRAVAKPPAAPA